MAPVSPQNPNTTIRPIQYRDLEVMEKRCAEEFEAETHSRLTDTCQQLSQARRWFGLLKLLSLFPNPYQYLFCCHVAEQEGKFRGMIQISPFNRTRAHLASRAGGRRSSRF